MRAGFVDTLRCPECRGRLALASEVSAGDRVVSGRLTCASCAAGWPIVRGIPRFVSSEEDYAQSFGVQWQRFRRTQIDEFNGTKESERRFENETGWSAGDLAGRLVLDGGCGSGRFAAVAARWGARVVAVDMAAGSAEACAQNLRELGYDGEVLQASLLRLPFGPSTFGNVFSLGVIQHTPDPGRIMRLLPELLEPAGQIAYWIYEERWTSYLHVKNALRLATRHLSPRFNYALSLGLTGAFFPLSLAMSSVPGLRRAASLLPVAGRHLDGLSLAAQWEWTLLDTLDWYSPAYELCQSEGEVIRALHDAGMEDVRRTPARGMAIVGRAPRAAG